MLISFRQTYGNNRKILYDIFEKDKNLHDLLNLCDINIQSFHNCSRETIDYYKSKVKIKNSLFLEFNDISYSETIKQLKVKLKELNCKYFLFTQDDTFTGGEKVCWKEVVDYTNEHENNFMLNLNVRVNHVNETLTPDEHRKSFDIWKLDTVYISYRGIFGMDDSPYICSIDMLDIIYDKEYLTKGSVWDCEQYLFDKFKYQKLNRYLLSVQESVLKCYNLLGRTVSKRDLYLSELRNKKLI